LLLLAEGTGNGEVKETGMPMRRYAMPYHDTGWKSTDSGTREI